MTRYVCIHGHFYQPPRENPWLDAVELQESAYPHHDWNERVTAECYAQNAASRILDEHGSITRITNNYAGISFNVGPTLLGWLAQHAPEVHASVVAADRVSRDRWGHGSAMAQPYNHMIMPLATPRDRRTQVRWGIADFRHRFGRDPEGMWLPETAVDVDTLETLAEHDIGFTLLEPHQAARVRALDGDEDSWVEVAGGSIDTTIPYVVRLPSGRTIVVLFYDGPISRAVAFEGLLADGERFAQRLLRAAAAVGDGDGLVHIATDGESYGHHHRHGDMALAAALAHLEDDADVELINHAAFLERHPPQLEVEIAPDTSWSCAHGIERWRSDCGCADGGHPEWDQTWRAPLRESLDWLRDQLEDPFEAAASQVLADPWAARDDYIEVVLDRGAVDGFLARHAGRQLDPDERTRALQLLELQRHAMLMYTSCGWFFDDLCRIETIQVLRYAGRAIQLARGLFGATVEEGFLVRLARARSNDPECGDGAQVYDRYVRSAEVDLEAVGAHYAVSSLFERYGPTTRVHAYEVTRSADRSQRAGDAGLSVGRLRVRSTVTEVATELEYGVLHLGDHNLDGRVRPAGSDAALDELAADLEAAFAVADFPEVITRLEHHFGGERYSLRDLFRDEQRHVLRRILDSSVEDARAAYRSIYRTRAPLMRFLIDLGARVPPTFHRAAEIVVNDDLRRAFRDPDLDPARVRHLIADAEAWGLELDTAGLAHELQGTIDRLTDQVARELPQPALFERFAEGGTAFLQQAETLIRFARELPFEVDLWRAQNTFYDAVQRAYPELAARAAAGEQRAATWVGHFGRLGDALSVAVP